MPIKRCGPSFVSPAGPLLRKTQATVKLPVNERWHWHVCSQLVLETNAFLDFLNYFFPPNPCFPASLVFTNQQVNPLVSEKLLCVLHSSSYAVLWEFSGHFHGCLNTNDSRSWEDASSFKPKPPLCLISTSAHWWLSYLKNHYYSAFDQKKLYNSVSVTWNDWKPCRETSSIHGGS